MWLVSLEAGAAGAEQEKRESSRSQHSKESGGPSHNGTYGPLWGIGFYSEWQRELQDCLSRGMTRSDLGVNHSGRLIEIYCRVGKRAGEPARSLYTNAGQNDDDWGQSNNSGGGEKWSDAGHNLKVELEVLLIDWMWLKAEYEVLPLDWMWVLEKEDSRLTPRFWGLAMEEQNCHYFRWKSLSAVYQLSMWNCWIKQLNI